MKKKRARGVAVILAILMAMVLLHVGAAYASRPGGGSSYSGGSHSSGGGSHSYGGGSHSYGGGSSYSGGSHSYGGGSSHSGGYSGSGRSSDTLGVFFGIVLFVVFLAYISSNRRFRGMEWSTGGSVAPAIPPPPIRTQLEQLRRTDPAFSIIVFEDFLYFLYAEMHRARGASSIDALAPYLSDNARAALRGDGRIAEVTGIIIGSLTYDNIVVSADGSATVTVIVESNYVERYRPQGEQRFFAKEEITLTRAAGARSRTPDKARTLNCPNCGGPLSAIRGKTCGYCHTQIDSGTKDWAITFIRVLERETRGPLLTSNVEEEGTNLPTIVDPNARAVFAQIQAKDPTFQWARLQQRVGLIFQEFHAGWVGRDPAKMRPFLSDNLFQSQLYWIDLYRAARCINRTDGARITNLELASATTDQYYDSITVRLYGTGLDYTVSEEGKVLSGSTSRPRAYSEYWTLIRGAQKKPTDKGDTQCPNCGAPLNINMAGNCQYCGVKVTSGEYDWVLSRIEQDEAYTG